jgi:hypothetical protein
MFSLHGLFGRDRRDVLNAKARERYRTAEGRAASERSTRRWYASGGAERIRAAARRRLYGLSPEQFERLLVVQGDRCALPGCDGQPTDVDHDHITGRVRGLLCRRCNVAVGFVEKHGAAVAAYLDRANGEKE